MTEETPSYLTLTKPSCRMALVSICVPALGLYGLGGMGTSPIYDPPVYTKVHQILFIEGYTYERYTLIIEMWLNRLCYKKTTLHVDDYKISVG